MREAKSMLNKKEFHGHKIKVQTEDITRTELVATTLQIPLPDDDQVPPLSFYMSKPDVSNNLLIMVLVWLITVFDFYLVGFLVNTFEQIFFSVIASGISEFVAQAFGGYMLAQLGARKSLCFSYVIAGIGGLMMLAYGLDH